MQACREVCTRQHVLYKVCAVAGCMTTDVEPQQPLHSTIASKSTTHVHHSVISEADGQEQSTYVTVG